MDIPAHREDGEFKARKAKADIDRLQAKIGQDTLTLAHEDYRYQPVGKPKQMGLTLVTPNRTTCLTGIRFRGMFRMKGTGPMSAKILIFRPHFFNYRLRFLNSQAIHQMRLKGAIPAEYPIDRESEWKPPDDLVDTQAKYGPPPTPPDS